MTWRGLSGGPYTAATTALQDGARRAADVNAEFRKAEPHSHHSPFHLNAIEHSCRG